MIAKRLPGALTLLRDAPRGNSMMIMFMRYSAMAAIGAMIICGSPASGQERGPSKWSGFCDLDVGPPKPCKISDEVSADGQHDLRFAFAGTAVSFFGRNAGPWWQGELNGRPAMGYERSRGYVVFSTTDLKTTFEWCRKLSAGPQC